MDQNPEPEGEPVSPGTNRFSANLSPIALRFPDVGSRIQSPDLGPRIEVLNPDSTRSTIRFMGKLLHSRHDPEKEARDWVAKESLREGDGVVLFGIGLGYSIRPILDRLGPSGRLTAIEPNLEIFRAALVLRDLTRELSDPRLELVVGGTEPELTRRISQALEGMDEGEGSRKKVLIYRPSLSCLPPGYGSLERVLQGILMERRFPILFKDLEERNFFANLDAVLLSPGFRNLEGKFSGVPSVLVGAGPSLDGCVAELVRQKHRYLIFATDTALPVLQENGIPPDFVLTVDPQPLSVFHFLGSAEPPPSLIFLPTASPLVVHLFRGNRWVVLKKTSSRFRSVEPLLKEKGFCESGGSVACMGLELLIRMGTNPIYLLGVDFSFPFSRNYATGTFEEKRERFATLAGVPERFYPAGAQEEEGQFPIESNLPKNVWTQLNLHQYLREMDLLIRSHPGTRVMNLRSHGARIRETRSVQSLGEGEGFKTVAFKPTVPRLGPEVPPAGLRQKIIEIFRQSDG